jgi:uncharacterized damage-inducible protein DinB
MQDSTPYLTLFAYHWHTTRSLMDGAAKLSEADYRHNPGYGHGSLHDLLFHLLRTDVNWRRALETGRQLAPINPQDFPDLAALRAGFEAEQQAWQILLDGWRAEDIAGSVQLTNWRGEAMTIPLWRVLQHVVLHGMQHHAELAQALTAKGQSPGNLDFIFFS